MLDMECLVFICYHRKFISFIPRNFIPYNGEIHYHNPPIPPLPLLSKDISNLISWDLILAYYLVTLYLIILELSGLKSKLNMI